MDPSAEKQYKKDTRYCLLCKKNETREECSWGPQMWDRYTTGGLDIGEEKDHEVAMAQSQLSSAAKDIKTLQKRLGKKEKNIPAWMQAKITDTEHNMDAAAGYTKKEEFVSEKKKGLWDNIHAKRKRGERPAKPGEEGYPKTLNVEGVLTYKEFMTEAAAWTKKSGKNPSGGLNERGRRSYERENPGSDLKAPSKKVGNPRRASFCARMSGMKKKLTSKKTANDPNSRINKSLRAWNC